MGLVRGPSQTRRHCEVPAHALTLQGKTVQMITFLGMLVQELIFPILVVVPNSTIANWMREFKRWAPHVRAVQYCGIAASREVIRAYELYHKGTKELKFHVLVATYEAVTNPKEFGLVYNRVKRWEALIVDEGQRREWLGTCTSS